MSVLPIKKYAVMNLSLDDPDRKSDYLVKVDTANATRFHMPADIGMYSYLYPSNTVIYYCQNALDDLKNKESYTMKEADNMIAAMKSDVSKYINDVINVSTTNFDKTPSKYTNDRLSINILSTSTQEGV